jgi:hypothetical protein
MGDVTENPQHGASQAGFHKFDWIAAIRHDERLGDGIKYVLQNIALVYLKHDGNGLLYARQSTVADELRVTTRQIQKAYAEAKRLRYFELVTERTRGRGHYTADTYQLVIPEQCSSIKRPERIDRKTRTDRQKDPNNVRKRPERVDSVTSTNLTIKGGEQGEKQGGEQGTTPTPLPSAGDPPLAALAQSDPAPAPLAHGNPYGEPLNHQDVEHQWGWVEYLERNYPDLKGIVDHPPMYCDKHPIGTTDDCGACKGRRKLLERWQEAKDDWNEYNADCLDNIRDCEYCRHSKGKFTNQIGDMFWCEHPDELHEPRNYDWNLPRGDL